jgi:hypothetical protein
MSLAVIWVDFLNPMTIFQFPTALGLYIEHTSVTDIPETSGFGLNDLNA